MPAQTKFFILVGLLVAVVMLFVIYDRATNYLDRQRLDSLNRDSLRLLSHIQSRKDKIRAADKRSADILTWVAIEADVFRRDGELQRLWDELEHVEVKRLMILRDHPEWAR